MRLSHLASLVVALFSSALPALASACVTQEEYDRNQTAVGTWYVSFRTTAGSYSLATSPCSGTYSQARNCSAYDAYIARLEAGKAACGAGCTISWNNQETYYSEAPVRYYWRASVLTAGGQGYTGYTNQELTISRSSTSWPAGYDNTVCAVCGDGTAGKGFSIRAANEGEIVVTNRCMDGCEIAELSVNPIGMNYDATDGTYWWTGWARFSGQVCVAGDPLPVESQDPAPADSPIPEPDGEVCATTDNGTTVCQDKDYGENCGYLNGSYVCLGKTDPDECWVDTDGSRWCGDAAPTPPVPDSGTGGQKATPDDTVAAKGPDGTQNTYNYYNTGTVAGSSRPVPDSGANPNRPDSSNPSTEPTPTTCVGDNCGAGTGTDPGALPGYEACASGADPASCPTFGATLASYVEQLQDAPIVAAWSNIGSSLPSGSCPSANISVFGATYSLSEFGCQIWDETVAPLLNLVFLFVWPFMAIRIVMSA